jgi:hypothetical protein
MIDLPAAAAIIVILLIQVDQEELFPEVVC